MAWRVNTQHIDIIYKKFTEDMLSDTVGPDAEHEVRRYSGAASMLLSGVFDPVLGHCQDGLLTTETQLHGKGSWLFLPKPPKSPVGIFDCNLKFFRPLH
jgi:hypothetical protein